MMSRSFMLPSENGVKQASMPLGRFCKWKKEGNFRPGAQKKTCRKQAFPCFCAAGRLYAYYAEPFLRVRALHPFRRKGEGGKVPSEQAVFFLRRMPLHREKSAVCRRGYRFRPAALLSFPAMLHSRGGVCRTAFFPSFLRRWGEKKQDAALKEKRPPEYPAAGSPPEEGRRARNYFTV
ncbi:hypothetical protein [Mailhella massiliensis]|uniref:hypothetical protein n=1 Tax=Mailhella massiliensis TaxID=1903261 RepID=UPI0023F39893|nr:hypothetical protein [Mailhella massiliensis]